MLYKYNYNKTLIQFAKSNRKQENDAANRLWYYLRNRRLAGYKFRREYPIHNYILDFYCMEKKLALELDGGQHSESATYDKRRDFQLSNLGIKVLRFWDIDIFQNISNVLEQIILVIDVIPAPEPHPSPLLKGEGKI